MSESNNNEVFASQDDYRYGFADKDISIFDTGKGLNEEVVRTISKIKKEPEWMTEFRVKSFHQFEAMPMPLAALAHFARTSAQLVSR